MATSRGLLLAAVIVAISHGELCSLAKSSWSAKNVESCEDNRVVVEEGNGTLDLTAWTADNFEKVFADQEKTITGGIMIDGSSLTRIDMTLETIDKKVTITVANCLNLETLDIELDVDKTSLPVLHISGNRKLTEFTLGDLIKLKTDEHKLADESYIQIENECKLKDANGIVTKAETDLAGCKAIYGDFRIKSKDALPNDMKNIKELKYIQGCLEISGTDVTRFNELTFLVNTESKAGGCKTKHKITNNKKMCIHPPEAHELKQRFPQMEITGNANCDGECPGDYVVKERDAACKIITDSLIVTGNDGNLKYLQNIREIRGTLEIESTSIENFNFLDNLEKLNTDNISSGPVFTLKYNRNMKSFQLPKLTDFVMNPGQVPVYLEKNGGFELEDSFYQKLGLKKGDIIQNEDPIVITTIATTTAPQVLITPKSGFRLTAYDNISFSVAVTIAVLVFLLIVLLFAAVTLFFIFGFCCSKLCCKGGDTSKWSYSPWDLKSQPIPSICRFSTDDMTFMDEAEATIKKNKIEIAKLDAKHYSQTDYKALTFPNGNALSFFATPEELEDYKKYEKERDPKIYLKLNVDKTADIDGQYGIRFLRNRKDTGKDIQYRTQPDLLCHFWNKLNVQPVYVDDFSNTAKRMVQAVAGRFADEIILLKKKKKAIGEFGVNFGTDPFQKFENSRQVVSNSSLTLSFFPHWPDYFFHRYNPALDKFEMPEKTVKYEPFIFTNEKTFVPRMITCLLNVPQGQQLNITYNDVLMFLKLTYPLTCGKARGNLSWGVARNPTSGQFYLSMNKSHVRIVGETRGDFEALRKLLNIPSIIDGEGHPMMQYNWVFLGNYVSGHPQSLETILLLLGLQKIMGRESVVLLRGPLEFTEINEQYGFHELLTTRFGKKNGNQLFKKFNGVFAQFPLNCIIGQRICCTSGGFHEADIEGRFPDVSEARAIHCLLNSTNYNKVFSLPNYTVKYYFDCVDTKGGYYYGERILSEIAKKRGWLTFFTTTPMECGLGEFGETTPAALFALSSVVGLQGHGGQKTRMAVVAEVNAETEHVAFHGILNGNETFKYDKLNKKIDMGTSAAPATGDKDAPKSEDTAAVVEALGVLLAESKLAASESKEVASNGKATASASKEVMSKSKETVSKSKEVASKTSQDQD